MPLEESLSRINGYILGRYNGNLAALLLFGSAHTRHFVEGKSDIDTIILLKEQKSLNFEAETKLLLEQLKQYDFRTQYFHTLAGAVAYIQKRTSFSTYITITSEDGSRILYSTPEFERTREFLRQNPPSKEEIKKHVQEKDEFELEGYFKKETDEKKTRSLFAHIRRKVQVMNYFRTGNLVFDFDRCIAGIDIPEEEREKLKELYAVYAARKTLLEPAQAEYFALARRLTEKILKM